MKKIKLFLSVILTIVFFASCTTSNRVTDGRFFQKRKYNKGFHINSTSRVKAKETTVNYDLAVAEQAVVENQVEETTKPIVQEKTTDLSYTSKQEEVIIPNESNYASKQETIVPNKQNYVSSEEILAANTKIIEKTKLETKQAKKELKNPKQASPSAKSAGDNQLVALLLCLFLGMFGVHDFYLGHITNGILKLLGILLYVVLVVLGAALLSPFLITLGYIVVVALGIWVLIDLIRIITGQLQPKGGRYSSTL